MMRGRLMNPMVLVKDAKGKNYAVPAFNTNGGTYEITRAALEAAEEARSPLILQAYEPNCEYRGFEYVVEQVNFLCDFLHITVPVALHLDHGKSFDSVLQAMHAGFTGIMFDASDKPLEENIRLMNKVTEIARPLGIAVEAEIGHVKGNEPEAKKQVGRYEPPEEPSIPPVYTDVREAVEFVSRTDVDLLAVSVGTTHGVYKRQDKIDFSLLDSLKENIEVPLVQHGTCGISLTNLSKLAKHGMVKINFGEPFRFNYIRYFYDLSDTSEHLWHPWKILRDVKDRLKTDMVDLIHALGSDGKA